MNAINNVFSINIIFPSLVVIITIIKWYLNLRQKTSISNNINQVPSNFKHFITINDHKKAGNYNITKLKLDNFSILVNGILLIVLTSGGLIQFMDTHITSYLSYNYPITQGVLLIIAILTINTVVNLPFSLYSTFYIEERFGFNRTNLKLFFKDIVMTTLMSAAIGIPLLYFIIWLMNIMGSFWWLWVWITFCMFNMLIMVIYPTIIAPIFNKFTPLEDESLKNRIYQLTKKCGFKINGIFIMDGSKRSSHGNAYFTGIGKSKRIVFFDTLIKQLNHEEIEAILAHELGHFKKKHIIKQIGISFLFSLVILYILNLLINQPIFYSALGVTNITNYNALILFILLLGVVLFPLSPIANFISRKNEFEADNFAKQLSGKEYLINGLIKLYKENSATLTPDCIYASFYYSHPPASVRIKNLDCK